MILYFLDKYKFSFAELKVGIQWRAWREAKRWESSDENRPFIRNYHIFAES